MTLHDFAIYEMEQCYKRFSLHMDFLMFEKEMFLPASRCSKWPGSTNWAGGCVGVIRKAGLCGWHAAEKSPRCDGSLGYAGNATKIEREMELAKLVPAAWSQN